MFQRVPCLWKCIHKVRDHAHPLRALSREEDRGRRLRRTRLRGLAPV